MIMKTYHIISTDGKWAVKLQGATRASRVFTDQREALVWVGTRCDRVVVHNKDGTVAYIAEFKRDKL